MFLELREHIEPFSQILRNLLLFSPYAFWAVFFVLKKVLLKYIVEFVYNLFFMFEKLYFLVFVLT